MRTLVISDLHLGAGRGRPRLEDDAAVEKLAAAIANYDRLVLLGDIIELRELRMRDALAAASRVLPRLTRNLPRGAEVIVVPGNHDHQLLAPWIARRGRLDKPEPLRPETVVDWEEGEPLQQLAALLEQRGANVRAAYPGVWLRTDIYAHHGHYLDRLTTTPGFERLAAGAMAKMLKAAPAEKATVGDYERVLAPIYAWMYAISEHGGDGDPVDGPEAGNSSKVLRLVNDSRGLSAQALKLGLAGVVNALEVAGLGDLSANLAGENLRRASLAAYGQVLASLDLAPPYAIFGHTHRAGPLPTDDMIDWRSQSGVRLFNSGCWVNEYTFLGTEPAISPYRAGFAIDFDDTSRPRLLNLLDA